MFLKMHFGAAEAAPFQRRRLYKGLLSQNSSVDSFRIPNLLEHTIAHAGGLLLRSAASKSCDYAEAAGLRCWKHSRQNTGRPCVGRKGTVVSLPQPEQMARVSTLL
jgi:hypothetical protein